MVCRSGCIQVVTRYVCRIVFLAFGTMPILNQCRKAFFIVSDVNITESVYGAISFRRLSMLTWIRTKDSKRVYIWFEKSALLKSFRRKSQCIW